MSQLDPFQALVDALRRTLTTNPPPPSPVTSPSPAPANTTGPSSPPPYASPKAKPAPYSGSAEDCSGFLLQCELVLEMQPHLYPNEASKIAFVISQLSGKALQWADSIWSQHGAITQSYLAFVSHFREDWNLWVRLHLAAWEDSIGLEKFIQFSIRCATRMQACLQEHQDQLLPNMLLCRSEPVSSPEPANESMDVENSRLSPFERRRRLTLNLCLYCGAPGHVIAACPNFVSGALCRQLRLKTSPSPTIYQINSITGRPLSRKSVRTVAGPIKLQVGLLHQEELHLLVLEDSTADMVLGRPWLEQHNPTISWKTGEILKWGDTCFSHCLTELPVPSPPSSDLSLCTTSIESPVEHRSIDIPNLRLTPVKGVKEDIIVNYCGVRRLKVLSSTASPKGLAAVTASSQRQFFQHLVPPRRLNVFPNLTSSSSILPSTKSVPQNTLPFSSYTRILYLWFPFCTQQENLSMSSSASSCKFVQAAIKTRSSGPRLGVHAPQLSGFHPVK
ncbi:Retrotransposon-like protein 1 [Anabarilius grahami]|uniref:Retrotransposon-like protein 1 n=1 Tax=Anabarilius grahami TaxID=495550 RepID=A0A3N0YQ64_ANAGA|nr:Retrotransposon-like protein 1 [Anabarilius grahami]